MEVMVKGDVAGLFKFETARVDGDGVEIPGTRKVAADWFPNLITNGGLNRMGSNGDAMNICQIGSGNTTPTFSDSALVSRLAANNTRTTDGTGVSPSSPYYVWRRNKYRFNASGSTRNIAEVGVGWATTGSLFSRALVLDGSGNPTTIAVLGDEILDVTYEFRYYPLLTDVTGTVTFTGNIGGTYDWIMRPARVDTVDGNATTPGWAIGETGPHMSAVNSFGTKRSVYSGDIGAVTGVPSGTKQDGVTMVAQAYTTDSYEAKYTTTLGIALGNFTPPGVRSLMVYLGLGPYQFQFDPPIPKTEDDELVLTLSHKWGRRT